MSPAGNQTPNGAPRFAAQPAPHHPYRALPLPRPRLQVFPNLKAALSYKAVTRPIAELILKDPKLSKAAEDPKTNVTLWVPPQL